MKFVMMLVILSLVISIALPVFAETEVKFRNKGLNVILNFPDGWGEDSYITSYGVEGLVFTNKTMKYPWGFYAVGKEYTENYYGDTIAQLYISVNVLNRAEEYSSIQDLHKDERDWIKQISSDYSYKSMGITSYIYTYQITLCNCKTTKITKELHSSTGVFRDKYDTWYLININNKYLFVICTARMYETKYTFDRNPMETEIVGIIKSMKITKTTSTLKQKNDAQTYFNMGLTFLMQSTMMMQ